MMLSETAVSLPSDRELLITRTFDAPRRLVFEAWTDPAHLRQWYGCPEAPLVVCEHELRPGGARRNVIRMPDGTTHAFSGVYREIVRPERLVYTERYENVPGADSVVTVEFEEHEDGTTMRNRVLHHSRAARDAQLEAFARTGSDEAFDRLADHVARPTPTLQERDARPYVSIPVRATLGEWPRVNALVPELFGWLAQRGIAPAGGLFYRYWVEGDARTEFELEVGVPVAQPVDGDGRVDAGSIDAGTYLTYIHHGHPDGLRRVHGEIQAWAAEHGVELALRGWYQSFLTDPAEQPDLNEWDTEMAYRVVR
jgi:uncharacterized protein YndB with AHSA1/START domain/effector-binding domain-containing protein